MADEGSIYCHKYKCGDVLTDGKKEYLVLQCGDCDHGPCYYLKACGLQFSWLAQEADEKLTFVRHTTPEVTVPSFHRLFEAEVEWQLGSYVLEMESFTISMKNLKALCEKFYKYGKTGCEAELM